MTTGDQSPTHDTRATLITPPGEGGIGIIRLTGPCAPGVLAECFSPLGKETNSIQQGELAYGSITRGDQILDEVIVARTGDQRYEVNCHGGTAAVRAVINRLVAHRGVIERNWQETLSEQHNTTSPLSRESIQTTAMTHLPRVETRLGATMLLHQYNGALTDCCQSVLDDLNATRNSGQRLSSLLGRSLLGRALIRPPRVLIAGPPNVGKSTLLNALLERERVIVHDTPGTTRDIVRETISLRGVPFEMIDSAGIRHDADTLESQAISRALDLFDKCDIVIWVKDATTLPSDQSAKIPEITDDKRVICVHNKIDVLEKRGETELFPSPDDEMHIPSIPISARERMRLEHLETKLLKPYEPLIADVEEGCPFPFTRAMEKCLQNVRRMATTDPPGAVRTLRDAMGLSPYQ
ncbi:MAG: GTP-binding protein [Planctomycetota bacterium]